MTANPSGPREPMARPLSRDACVWSNGVCLTHCLHDGAEDARDCIHAAEQANRPTGFDSPSFTTCAVVIGAGLLIACAAWALFVELALLGAP